MKKESLFTILLMAASLGDAQDLQLNDRDYFERQGVNVLVFSNSFNGGFNDEKNSGIEIIHHGVRTVQGGAVRLSNTPEQWDLVPKMINRKVNREKGSIEVAMRYDDYDFDSRVVVTAQGKAVEISVWLDKPVPEKLAGEAGFNLELPTAMHLLMPQIENAIRCLAQECGAVVYKTHKDGVEECLSLESILKTPEVIDCFEETFLFITISPDISSITETDSAFASGSIKVISGSPFAVSHFETALLLTPKISASCA